MSGMQNPLRHGSRGHASLTIVALVLMMTSFLPDASADISYVYDDAGRLRAVIDPTSDTAVYAYL